MVKVLNSERYVSTWRTQGRKEGRILGRKEEEKEGRREGRILGWMNGRKEGGQSLVLPVPGGELSQTKGQGLHNVI